MRCVQHDRVVAARSDGLCSVCELEGERELAEWLDETHASGRFALLVVPRVTEMPASEGQRGRHCGYAVPATPMRWPSGSVNWPTTSVPGLPSGPLTRVPPRRSALTSADSTSSTPT